MKTIVTYLAIFILVTTCLTTCKKYPEGGLEKRGPKNIIGDWKLSLYEVNGIDSTDLINYNGNENYKKVSFLKEQTTGRKHTYARPYYSQETIVTFAENNKIFYFNTNGSYEGSKKCSGTTQICYKQFLNPEKGSKCVWEIIKLVKKEIIITSTQLNKYKIILKR